MKHGAIVFVAVLALVFSTAVVSAQGLPTLPGLPNFGSMFGGGGSCDEAGPGPFGIDGHVAWNYQTVDLSFNTLDAGLGPLGALKHAYRFNGVQFGLSAHAVSRTGVGGIVTFDILLTGSSTDTENINESIFGGIFLPEGSRHWRAKNDTYCIDGMGFYSLFGSAALVGGFRWNHLETTFDNPSGILLPGALPGDEAVLTMNVYQPYVGVMIDQGGADRVLRLGFIVWPQLYGSVKYERTAGAVLVNGIRAHGLTAKVNEGYFWELFGEYGLRQQMMGGAAVSIFGKWTQYHLKGTFNIESDLIGVGFLDSDYWNIAMHRNSWTAGIRLDVPFALPVPSFF